jgi:hypothetical protein
MCVNQYYVINLYLWNVLVMHQPLVGLLTLPSVPGLDVAGIVTQSVRA